MSRNGVITCTCMCNYHFVDMQCQDNALQEHCATSYTGLLQLQVPPAKGLSFPTCQVRVVRFYMILSQPMLPPPPSSPPSPPPLHQLPISVGTAGPKLPNRMPKYMPKRLPEYMPERMPEYMPKRLPEYMPDRMPEDMPDRMSEYMPDRMSEYMPDRMSEYMPDRMPEYMPD